MSSAFSSFYCAPRALQTPKLSRYPFEFENSFHLLPYNCAIELVVRYIKGNKVESLVRYVETRPIGYYRHVVEALELGKF